MIVDEMHEEHPELLKDQYWEEVVPTELPYTVASEHYRRYEPKGSAENYKVKQADAMYANIIPSKRQNFDDMYADYVSWIDSFLIYLRRWITLKLCDAIAGECRYTDGWTTKKFKLVQSSNNTYGIVA